MDTEIIKLLINAESSIKGTSLVTLYLPENGNL